MFTNETKLEKNQWQIMATTEE